MKKYITIVLTVFLFSCSEEVNKTDSIDFSNSKDMILEDSYSDILTFSKRKNQDIIEHLYQEAMEKDTKLSFLKDKIARIGSVKEDSLSDLREYITYNNQYYSSANRYIEMIQDSTKRKAMKILFANSKKKYKDEIVNHEKASDLTIRLGYELYDQEKILKLIITEGLIDSYQENLPNIKSINDLNEKYKSLILETEEYIDPQ